MPYAEVQAFNALCNYLEILGIDNVKQLLLGSGQLPPDDPQIFLGSMSPLRRSSSTTSHHLEHLLALLCLAILMVYYCHVFLERLSSNHLILCSGDSCTGHITPAGYEGFRVLWAQDAACPYQFCDYNPGSRISTALGSAIDIDELTPAEAATTLQYNSRRQAIVDDLIFKQLNSSLKAQDTINARWANKCSREGTPSTGPGTSTAKRTYCSAKKLTRGKANLLVHHEPSMVVDPDLAVGPPVTGTSAKSSALPQEEDELVEYESEVKLSYSEGPSKVYEY
ncbi:hypothetical protein NUW54_g2618 [Trametes sanguinea]|uniref:Uncharacterized protein n=2 Tax=Trametes sanguinea TaxID=158606 RepID=A0ACC1Q570_9APHY|nr:hypothetical protein NUW54_g2787 [Trametes sanguinea]KAJ3009986.1 hypothetical protein NUW54_g2618 [Trametes sanguinea]